MMVLFRLRELRAAYAHAAAGGQALHIMPTSFAYRRADTPSCFKRDDVIFEGSCIIAHLIDHDHQRLVATARRLGVRKIRVEKLGVSGQHIDLCSGPLRKALSECTVPPPSSEAQAVA